MIDTLQLINIFIWAIGAIHIIWYASSLAVWVWIRANAPTLADREITQLRSELSDLRRGHDGSV